MLTDLSAPEALAYVSFLRSNGYDCVFPVDQNRYACLVKLAYTTAIIQGRWFDRGGYDDRWCYETYQDAFAALLEWAENDFKDEPMGWHRHPRSGRRRVKGDWMQETVEP